MSPVDRDVARRKLATIVRCLGRIARARDVTLEQYRSDPDLQAILERQLELTVTAAVDLNVHLIVEAGHPTPADAFSSFEQLARQTGALPAELARRLAPCTGLRNRLAHAYDDIDHELVHHGLREALEVFPRYVAAIEAHLTAGEPPAR